MTGLSLERQLELERVERNDAWLLELDWGGTITADGGLDDAGLVALCAALDGNTALRSIYLRCNKSLSDNSGGMLAAVLPRCGVEHVDLRYGTGISDVTRGEIKEILAAKLARREERRKAWEEEPPSNDEALRAQGAAAKALARARARDVRGASSAFRSRCCPNTDASASMPVDLGGLQEGSRPVVFRGTLTSERPKLDERARSHASLLRAEDEASLARRQEQQSRREAQREPAPPVMREKGRPVVARRGGAEAFTSTVDKGRSLMAKKTGRDGTSLLHVAARAGEQAAPLMGWLLQHGARSAAQTGEGATPLHVSAATGNAEGCKLLLKRARGRTPSGRARRQLLAQARDGEGRTALHTAAIHGHAEAVETLLEESERYGKSWAADSSGQNALHHAAEHGRLAVVRVLLAHAQQTKAVGVVDATTRDGTTPLMVAVATRHVAIAGQLLAAGAAVDSVDQSGRTALFAAAHTGSVGLARLLLERGAAVRHADKQGVTPLFVAAQHNNGGCVELLVAAGASIDRRGLRGRTPLYVAAEDGRCDAVDCMLRMVDVQHRATREAIAALKQKEFLYTEGLAGRGQLAATDPDEETLLKTRLRDAAVEQERLHAELDRIDRTVDVTDDRGRSPLWAAVANRQVEVVKRLLEGRADPDLPNTTGAARPLLCLPRHASLMC